MPNCFSNWLHHFTVPPAVCAGSNYSISSLTLDTIIFSLGIQVDMKRYLIVVLTCFALIVNDTEHIFMWLLAIGTFSLEMYIFKSFDHILIELCLLIFELQVFFIYSVHSTLIQCVICMDLIILCLSIHQMVGIWVI